MIGEINSDINSGTLYLSSRPNTEGRYSYPQLLVEAAQYHDDIWLADQLVSGRLLNTYEVVRGRQRRVSRIAHITLSETEFNRFYMRGLALYALEIGEPMLEICRFKSVSTPRRTSIDAIGSLISPYEVLSDLQLPYDERQTILALPNSGLTVCIPENGE